MRSLRVLLVPLCAALCAALAAHVAIDVVGDYVLPHDAYDDLAHGSRSFAALGAGGLFVLCAVAALAGAVREARGVDHAFCDALRSLVPRHFARFIALVAGLGIVCVVAMEALDAAGAGDASLDVGDLLGGSLALGVGVTLVCAFATATLAWFAVRFVARRRSLFVALVAVFAPRLERLAAGSLGARRHARIATRIGLRLGRVRPCRAPPPVLSAA